MTTTHEIDTLFNQAIFIFEARLEAQFSKKISSRALSRFLQLNSHHAISTFRSKKNVFSQTILSLILTKIIFLPKEKSKFIELLSKIRYQIMLHNMDPNNNKTLEWKTISKDSYQSIFSDPMVIVVKESLLIKNYKKNLLNISQKVGLDSFQTYCHLKLLEKAGYVTEEEGIYECTKEGELTSAVIEMSQESIRKYHKDNLKYVLSKLEKHDKESVKDRRVSTITFSASQEMFQRLKEEISDFEDKISEESIKEEIGDVYQLSIALIKRSESLV